MDYFKYNLPGLWFQIYRQVLEQNNNLNNDRLDKVQLREVTTSIFIASTNRGLVRPYSYTKFQVGLLELTKDVFTEGKREAITLAVKSALNGKSKVKEVTSDRTGTG
ncbi:MAG: hypothetical protein ISR95_00250 [Candidatus Marinimicrobia bacterium]|nr:hypothetical protein [Candidatus Neomarinimicrobiota bacterium]MBL7046061.1 hypothetical protein [Candidatus Neomarinimicrobiota bacterium]